MAPDEAILEVERSRGRDLLCEPLYEYLFRLALQGKIDGIIGGPPCTTFSRARSRSSGPKVLRRRYGHQRFGIESLTEAEAALLLQDNVLIFRMLFLIRVAQESRGEACFVAIEHPRDPAELSSEPVQRNLPSMWEWPEIQSLNLYTAQVDQGTLGHRDVKPTTLATSSWELFESLHNNVVSPGQRWVSSAPSDTLEGRIAHTRQASAWAPGLVQRIVAAWRSWSKDPEEDMRSAVNRLKVIAAILRQRGADMSAVQELCHVAEQRANKHKDSDDSHLSALTSNCQVPEVSKLTSKEEAFRQHVNRGHLPWRRDCRACLEAAAYHHACRRQKHPHAFSLCLDLCGPYKAGSDQAGLCRFGLVGVYTFPKFWNNGRPVVGDTTMGGVPEEASPDTGEQQEVHKPMKRIPEDHPIPEEFQEEDLPDIDGDPQEDPEPLDEDVKAADKADVKWKAIVTASLDPLPMIRIPFFEVVYKKKPSPVCQAVSQIYLRIKRLGLPLHRVHTDRGKEFLNTSFRVWCLSRDLMWTTTSSDLPQSNGLAERYVGIIKQQARALLRHSGLEVLHWPSAMRHATYSLYRQAVKPLGVPVRAIYPFGATVYIREKAWRVKNWSVRAVQGRILAPAMDVSKGWIVLVVRPDGKPAMLISTLCYEEVKEPPSVELGKDDPADALPIPVHPADKATGKPVHFPAASGAGVGPETIAPASSSGGLSHPRHVLPATSGLPTGAKLPKRRVTGKASLRHVYASSQGGGPANAPTTEEPSDEESAGPGETIKVWYAEPIQEESHKVCLVQCLDDTELMARDMQRQHPILREGLRDLLNKCVWQRPQEVSTALKELGVVGLFAKARMYGITPETYERPELTKLLCQYVQQVVPLAEFASIVISEGFESTWRRDFSTYDGSAKWVIPIGVFSNGRIRVLEEGINLDEANMCESRGLSLDISQSPQEFNPRRRHASLPYDGQRLLLTSFTPHGIQHLSSEEMAELKSLGFRPPQIAHKGIEAGQCVQVTSSPQESEMREEFVLEEPQAIAGQAYFPTDELEQELAFQGAILAQLVRSEQHALSESLRIDAVDVDVSSLMRLETERRNLETALTLNQAARVIQGDESTGGEGQMLAKASLMALGIQSAPDEKASEEEQPEIYQARTIGPDEVHQELEKWVPAMVEEYVGLTSQYKALLPMSANEITREEVESGRTEILPSKVVFTRKPPIGARRARIVACGNFSAKAVPIEGEEAQPHVLERRHLYAGGLDSIALRVQVRMAALRGWASAVVDIRKAFLNAPLAEDNKVNKKIILYPPRVLTRIGLISPDERWLVVRAVYGLEISPACWGRHRDKIKDLTWEHNGVRYTLQQSKSEPAVWMLMTVKGISGLLGIYVDDFMISGCPAVVSSGIAAIQRVWETSKPKCASEGVHFLGVDIRVQDGVYTMSQEGYVQELLQRHEGVTGTSLIPYPPEKDPEESEEVDLQRVREAQGWIGELTWLCTRTRVDIAWAVNKAAQLSAKRPLRATRVCQFIIRYLRQVPDLALIYQQMRATQPHSEASESLIETYTDASFAPSGERSQSGAVVLWAGGVLAWLSTRQTFVTLSSAESELCAALEGMALTYAVQDLVCELSTFEPPILLCDNIAAVSLILLPAGSWRTRHLRLRARYLHEQLADALTKPLAPARLKALMQHMGFDSPAVRALRLLVFASCIQHSSAQPYSHEEGFEEYVMLLVVIAIGIMVFKGLSMCLHFIWNLCRERCRRPALTVNGALAPEEDRVLQRREDSSATVLLDAAPNQPVVRRRLSTTTGSLGSADMAIFPKVGAVPKAAPTTPPNLLADTEAQLEEEAEVFDRYYERVVEPSDPYHPFADLSPSQYAGSDSFPIPESSSSSSSVRVESPKAAPKIGTPGLVYDPTAQGSQSISMAMSSFPVPVQAAPKHPPVKHAPVGLRDPLRELRLLGVSPEDWDDQVLIGHRVVTFGRDRFEHLPIQGVLVRWHSQWRVQRFDPRVAALSIPVERLAGLRRSYCTFRDGRQCIYIDDFRQATRGFNFWVSAMERQDRASHPERGCWVVNGSSSEGQHRSSS